MGKLAFEKKSRQMTESKQTVILQFTAAFPPFDAFDKIVLSSTLEWLEEWQWHFHHPHRQTVQMKANLF